MSDVLRISLFGFPSKPTPAASQFPSEELRAVQEDLAELTLLLKRAKAENASVSDKRILVRRCLEQGVQIEKTLRSARTEYRRTLRVE